MNIATEPMAPSVLMYSPDSIGLGHMRRHSAIAKRLSMAIPGISNLLLVGSAAGPFFDLPDGTDCIKLPSVLKTASNTWQPRSLNVSSQKAHNLRAGLICEAARMLCPDVFLVDHVPAGIWHELLPTLRMMRELPDPPRIILGLRDILGAPGDIRASWMREGIYDLIEEFYDYIFIYGCRDIFPADVHYGLSERFEEKIRYCGYICSDQPKTDPESARDNIGLGERPVVVVTAGGGHDAFPMMNFVFDTLAGFGRSCPFDTVIIAGPLMPAGQQDVLQAKADNLPITFLPATSQLQTYLSAADLVVTMGGYNTLMECVRLRKRTIVIPRTRPSAEQRIRAELFDDLGLAKHHNLEDSTSCDLARALTSGLDCSTAPTVSLAFDGLNGVAHAVSGMLNVEPVDRIPQVSEFDWKASAA